MNKVSSLSKEALVKFYNHKILNYINSECEKTIKFFSNAAELDKFETKQVETGDYFIDTPIYDYETIDKTKNNGIQARKVNFKLQIALKCKKMQKDLTTHLQTNLPKKSFASQTVKEAKATLESIFKEYEKLVDDGLNAIVNGGYLTVTSNGEIAYLKNNGENNQVVKSQFSYGTKITCRKSSSRRRRSHSCRHRRRKSIQKKF